MDNNYQNSIQNAVAGVSASAPLLDGIITLKNGVQLKKKPFPILLVQQVIGSFKYPPVPEYWDEDRKRGIKNPNNEDYIRQKDEVDTERGLAAIDAIIAFGTELVSVPEDVIKLEDDSWIDDLELVNISVRRDNRKARYLAWVRNVAITDGRDLELLSALIQNAMGTSGGAVAQAMDGFRDNS